MSISISADVVLDIIERLIRFPDARVCKHYVASLVLSELERAGFDVAQELAKAIVEADDETALRLLHEGRRGADDRSAFGELRVAAGDLLDAGRRFWRIRQGWGSAAVVWVDSVAGELVLFTRGEYRDRLLAAVPEPRGDVVMLELSGEPEDEGGDQCCIGGQAETDKAMQCLNHTRQALPGLESSR